MVYVFLFPAMLSAQKTLEFPTKVDKMWGVNKDFYIGEVIDVRDVSASNYIGRVQTGAFNSKNDAFLKNSLATELTTVVRQLVPNPKNSTTQLILKVNRLKIWEQTFYGTEEGYAFGDFQLIMKQDKPTTWWIATTVLSENEVVGM